MNQKLVSMNYESYKKRAYQYEIFKKLNEAEYEAANDDKRLTDAHIYDGLIRELEAMSVNANYEV